MENLRKLSSLRPLDLTNLPLPCNRKKLRENTLTFDHLQFQDTLVSSLSGFDFCPDFTLLLSFEKVLLYVPLLFLF